MNKITLIAKIRNKLGTKKSKYYRLKNKIPAIIYSKNKQNLPILLNLNQINLFFNNKKILNTHLLIKIKNKIIETKIKNIQKHPFKKKILHIDFMYK